VSRQQFLEARPRWPSHTNGTEIAGTLLAEINAALDEYGQ
jgi:hypothetical protein